MKQNCNCERRKPSYEVKLKIYNFSKSMLEYKKLVESTSLDDAIKNQKSEMDKIFKKHFEDTDQDKELFNDLVDMTLLGFATGGTIDLDAIRKDLEHDRQNTLN